MVPVLIHIRLRIEVFANIIIRFIVSFMRIFGCTKKSIKSQGNSVDHKNICTSHEFDTN